MTMIFRPGPRLIIPGVQVYSPRPAAGGASTWWDNNGAISGCVAAYQPKGAADLAASYINLANPGTYNAAPGVAPTFNPVTGWTLDGTTQYLTTAIVPTNNQQWSMLIRFSDFSAASGFRSLAGVNWTGGEGFIIAQYPTDRLYYNGGNISVSTAPASGVRGIAGNRGYLNGAVDGGVISSTATPNTLALAIGALRNAGGIIAHFPGKIQALAVYNVPLSGGNVATISASMAAL